MSWTAAILIITSAFMHALGNLVSKRRNPTVAFFFVADSSATLIVSPVLVVWRSLLPHLTLTVWGLLLATGVAKEVYFSGLTGAYRHGDMSLAYHLARGPASPVRGSDQHSRGTGGANRTQLDRDREQAWIDS
jgi:hypothetical protein